VNQEKAGNFLGYNPLKEDKNVWQRDLDGEKGKTAMS